MNLFYAEAALHVKWNNVYSLGGIVIWLNNVECAGIYGGGA